MWQFIYRAALGICWIPADALLEDRESAVESSEESAARMAQALREEYGMVLTGARATAPALRSPFATRMPSVSPQGSPSGSGRR